MVDFEEFGRALDGQAAKTAANEKAIAELATTTAAALAAINKSVDELRGEPGSGAEPGDDPDGEVPPGWTLIEGGVFPEGLDLTGRSQVIVRNNRITGGKVGIFIKNCRDLVIEDNAIEGVREDGIRLSNSGGSSDVIIRRNQIRRCGKNGIIAADEHEELQIISNRIEETGLNRAGNGIHGIYCKARDARIFRNVVLGTRWGNAISMRTSGLVLDNEIADVEREDTDGGAGIAYYSDGAAGPSGTLTIEGNEIDGASITGRNGAAIRLLPPAGREPEGPGGRVKRFEILSNRITTDRPNRAIVIAEIWRNPPHELMPKDNQILAA